LGFVWDSHFSGAFMIHLQCEYCGQKIKVPATRAGKTGRCPKCKRTVTVPAAQTPGPAERQEHSGALQLHSGDPAYDAALLDIPQKGGLSREADGSDISVEDLQGPAERSAAGETGPVGGLRLPWFMDVFLYPLNPAGIIRLISLWLLVCWLCPAVMELGLGIEYVPFVYALPVAYVAYYLTECIRHSAGGGRRAPDFWMHPTDSSKWECASQFFLAVGCIAVCFSPVSVYYVVRERTDLIYALLLACGGFFFPMTLLAVVMLDSFSGLNPALILGSILRTFLPYCGMVLLFCAGAWLFVRIDFRLYNFRFLPTVPFVLRVVQFYLLFVAVGLLGRFFQRHKERLDWEA
jgi:hypothetical protein